MPCSKTHLDRTLQASKVISPRDLQTLQMRANWAYHIALRIFQCHRRCVPHPVDLSNFFARPRTSFFSYPANLVRVCPRSWLCRHTHVTSRLISSTFRNDLLEKDLTAIKPFKFSFSGQLTSRVENGYSSSLSFQCLRTILVRRISWPRTQKLLVFVKE